MFVYPSGASMGSIPAHAGEPTGRRAGRWPTWVYPRACGGTDTQEVALPCVQGLSPRMRGNPSFLNLTRSRLGSIPAHAGEP